MQTAENSGSDSLVMGLLRGFFPLLVAALLVGATFGGAEIIRRVTLGQGFFAQQAADVFVTAFGLVVTTIVFAILSVRLFGVIKRWQADGRASAATGALVAVGITTLLILLPVILAFAMPQHPAPPR